MTGFQVRKGTAVGIHNNRGNGDDFTPERDAAGLVYGKDWSQTVVGSRRIAALRELRARARAARTPEEACLLAADALARHDKDVPFALFYLIEPDGKTAKVAATVGLPDGDDGVVPVLALDGRSYWRFADVRARHAAVTVDHLSTVMPEVQDGGWDDPPHTAVVLPIRAYAARELSGFLVAGVSPRLRLDEQYQGFLDLVSTQVSAAIISAQA